jgi:DNA invertase Pin-like site-specific DNA recombinase
MARSETPKRRCAIYTRKSSEEGLEQEFNSLHAQREACEAYIRSQRHEGWVVIPTAYDDGGFSGGTMERPGLQHLLADIRLGSVDVVVTYKVDRLTRALADFARLIEIFDRHEVSFVSVSQQFNTTTSMGRLTLNVLLSFAQFEREVTGERIRDKIAASKKKGMWMGGNPPLGYDVRDRKLLVNPAEAETVRGIFALYLELGCVRRLMEAVDRHGWTTKRCATSAGRMRGGRPISRGHLYRILSNPLYIGRIAHKAQLHPGQHEALIEGDTWAAVEAQLAANTAGHRRRAGASAPSLRIGAQPARRAARRQHRRAARAVARGQEWAPISLLHLASADHRVRRRAHFRVAASGSRR